MIASPPVSEVVRRFSARPWGAVFSRRLPLLVAQAKLAKILDLFLRSQDIEIGSERESTHADSLICTTKAAADVAVRIG
jgi:hypothetical protein